MLSTIAISEYLEGIDFPATKDQIIQYAEDRNAPPDILDTLQDMLEPPEGYYLSMAGIWDAVGTADLGGS